MRNKKERHIEKEVQSPACTLNWRTKFYIKAPLLLLLLLWIYIYLSLYIPQSLTIFLFLIDLFILIVLISIVVVVVVDHDVDLLETYINLVTVSLFYYS